IGSWMTCGWGTEEDTDRQVQGTVRDRQEEQGLPGRGRTGENIRSALYREGERIFGSKGTKCFKTTSY
ncbi:MAG: hypothetical protein ABEH43_02325, partial [Flavobacteriales bacterium]